MRLAVGDIVVYASHGAGHVAARERRVVLGTPQEVIVLELAGGLSVELPIERAHELLRPLASEADMSQVQKTLGADHAANRDSWLKRRRNSQAKLTGGDPIELAEIIRDSAHRQLTLPAKSQLSPGERDLFVKARQLLSTTRLPFPSGEKYCHNGGMALRHHHGVGLPGGPLRRSWPLPAVP